jgi:hypothetical protein
MGSSGFFIGFAGQGRVKFHHGVVNTILTGIEEAYVARRGRDWLGSSEKEIWESRTAMVLGPDHGENPHALRYFDPRESWEDLCACFMVGGPVTCAFILSLFTPTVGYGCRLGGYSIFFIVAFPAATFEALSWWQLPKPTPQSLRKLDEPRKTFVGRLVHLNTTNYANAAYGLRRTRTFKKYTLWLRIPVSTVLSIGRVFWGTVRGAKLGKRGRRSLVWSGRDGTVRRNKSNNARRRSS